MRFKKPKIILKTTEQMQRHFKGIANHYRIDALLLIDKNKGITLDEIVNNTSGNLKTISHHVNYLVHSGLVNKKYAGRFVAHSLSPYGKIFVKFIKDFQRVSLL